MASYSERSFAALLSAEQANQQAEGVEWSVVYFIGKAIVLALLSIAVAIEAKQIGGE